MEVNIKRNTFLETKTCLSFLRNKLANKFGNATFESWFKTLQIEKETENSITISFRSEFIKEWVEINYRESLLEIINEEKPSIIKLLLVSKNNQEDQSVEEHNNIVTNIAPNDNYDSISLQLEPNQTFENFITDEENKMAFTAIKSLTNNSNLFNNIKFSYLYAGVGLGKSHLLNAAATELKKLKKSFIFLSSERFAYHYTRAIKNNDVISFKEKFDNLDYILIDDIQFLQKKKATSSELLHILENALIRGAKIIITGTKKIIEYSELNSKLKSLLSSGIITTIDNPRIELKKKIITNKCKILNFSLSNEIISYLANIKFSSIREIEGALNKIMVYTTLLNNKITIEDLTDIAGEFFNDTHANINIEPNYIIKKVAKHFHLTASTLISKARKKEIVFARDIAIYLTKNNCNLSLSEIGNYFGKRDHATILHAYKKITQKKTVDLTLKIEIDALQSILEH